uniref:Uncharacterized protein n=1 Tax=Anopheles minimus TaxID=112268 RepID=A0A182WMZ8_9DIPT
MTMLFFPYSHHAFYVRIMVTFV